MSVRVRFRVGDSTHALVQQQNRTTVKHLFSVLSWGPRSRVIREGEAPFSLVSKTEVGAAARPSVGEVQNPAVPTDVHRVISELLARLYAVGHHDP